MANPALKKVSLAIKGVGSQGDGTVQVRSDYDLFIVVIIYHHFSLHLSYFLFFHKYFSFLPLSSIYPSLPSTLSKPSHFSLSVSISFSLSLSLFLSLSLSLSLSLFFFLSLSLSVSPLSFSISLSLSLSVCLCLSLFFSFLVLILLFCFFVSFFLYV